MRIAFTYNLQTDSSDLSQAEFDPPETVEFVFSTLERLGHEVVPLEVTRPVSEVIDSLRRLEPDLVFNTAEGQRGVCREASFPMLFEQLGIPYTGSGPRTCTVTLDKYLAKCIACEVGVPTPPARLLTERDSHVFDPQSLPLIVKPNFEGSSMGISEQAILRSSNDVSDRLAEALEQFPQGVLVEQFVEGIDVTVPFLAGSVPATDGVLTPCGYRFDDDSDETATDLYDYNRKHEQPEAVEVQVPADLSGDVRARIVEASRSLIEAFGVRDLARLDYRVAPDGTIAFLEIDALPSLEPGAPLYRAAHREGIETPESTLAYVLRNAIERYNLEADPIVEHDRDRSGASADGELLSSTHTVERRHEPIRIGLAYNRQRIEGNDDFEAAFDNLSTLRRLRNTLTSYDLEVVPLEATHGFVEHITADRPDVVFNIAEDRGGRNREVLVPSILEAMAIPFTGSRAGTMLATLDKSWAKTLVEQAGLSTPPCTILADADDKIPDSCSLPAIVKPRAEGSSKGIDAEGVVESRAALDARARHVADAYPAGAIVESYLSGRELTVGLVTSPPTESGEPTVRALPPMEITFADGNEHPVYSYERKIVPERRHEVRYEVPAPVSTEREQELREVARRAFGALGCRDVARIDLRLDASGTIHFLECNALPGLVPGWSDLPVIAEAAGLSYRALIGVILTPALGRMRSDTPGGAGRDVQPLVSTSLN